ncbi:MAG TPA: glycosyltransferase family 2 protein [Stellaceae bacterium]|nr:glycosyltransferase family 2 protein [Stellaceae bacterium]
MAKAADDEFRVAVLIPAFNEESTIGKTVRDFRAALPNARIYVYDNNSTDGTARAAREAGAIARHETRQGKGHVVRRMFADVEADIYVLVDGDDTYDALAAPRMIRRLLDGPCDMVTGCRLGAHEAAYRRGHRFGNWLLTALVRRFFRKGVSDMLSGYRVFSRRFVKSFPCLATGFEIETELTVHALQLNTPIDEAPTAYKERPPGSVSKLSTYRDGLRILRTILILVKEERPLFFFGVAAAAMAFASLALGLPVVLEFLRTGLVPRFPTAILSAALMLLASLSFASGLILDTVTRGRREVKRLAYLQHPPTCRAEADEMPAADSAPAQSGAPERLVQAG